MTARRTRAVVAVAVAVALAGCTAPEATPTGPPPTASVPSASPASAAERAAAIVSDMTPAQRVGQVFMVGVPATSDGGPAIAVVDDLAVGGVMLTGRSDLGVEATRALTDRIRAEMAPGATAGQPLTIATDQEGGTVQVLSGPGFSDIPTAVDQAALGPEALRSASAGWGAELAAAGIDLDLGPVADVCADDAQAAANPPIGELLRNYGTGLEQTAANASAFVAGLADAGVGTTLKHFPGLCAVDANTDTDSGVVDRVTGADAASVRAFAAAIDAGAGYVMTSSATYERIDAGAPAVYSSVVIEDVLRGRVGFTGVVVSDDLGNAAEVQGRPLGDRAVGFLAAGGDLVLNVNPDRIRPMVEAVAARVDTDPAFAERVREAAERVVASRLDD